MKRIVVLPDIQAPLHDKRLVQNLISFVADYQPDELWNVGDEADVTQPARWSRGTAEEYSGQLQADLDISAKVMSDFRDALGDKPYHVAGSNHLERLENYVRQYAPAFSSLRELRIEALMGYDRIGVDYHRKPYEGAPGWLLVHGHQGRLSNVAGMTALNFAKDTGYSVVCGHTHRAGLVHHTVGVNGKLTSLWGLEVGNAMQISKASYLKRGAANWAQAIGLLYVDGRRVTPALVPVRADGSFVVEGKTYGQRVAA